MLLQLQKPNLSLGYDTSANCALFIIVQTLLSNDRGRTLTRRALAPRLYS